MNIDEKTFFHQCTLRICSSFEIELLLKQSFDYIKTYIPLDSMYLFFYVPRLGALRFIAQADKDDGWLMDSLLPLPGVARNHFDSFATRPQTYVYNDMTHFRTIRIIAEIAGKPQGSLLLLPLIMEGNHIGAVGASNAQKEIFTADHAELLTLLHDPFAIAVANYKQHSDIVKLKNALDKDKQLLLAEMKQQTQNEIIGANFGLSQVMEMVSLVSPRDNPVLLLGETGVGKEVIANAIHNASSRKEGPFIKVNCGAIPDSLIDSELFGHEKGSFTGALELKRGHFERADKGTIFLDEIGELPMEAQVRLLRVLQHHEIERVGGDETLPVDIRIIAATHRDIESMVESGTFREDMWYRLNIFPINIPPLRERTGDIPAFVGHFLKKKSIELNFNEIPPLAPGDMDALINCEWKGNIRELENVIECALIRYTDGDLDFQWYFCGQSEPGPFLQTTLPIGTSLDECIALHIRNVLELSMGKISGTGGAAEILGVHPNTLRNKMKRLGIDHGKEL